MAPLQHFHLNILIQNVEDVELTNFVDTIGNEVGPDIPLHMFNIVHDKTDIINFIFPQHILDSLCLNCSILAPTNDQINQYNTAILHCIQQLEKNYYASDSFKEIQDANMVEPSHILEFMATHHINGLPPYLLKIKINGLY
jgi:hypothetical protein